MSAFSISPAAGANPDTPNAFPLGLQWQLDGVNVGDRSVSTVNFVAGDELAVELDPADSTIIIVTIPSATP